MAGVLGAGCLRLISRLLACAMIIVMPRADTEWNRHAIRAYHRASAALRDRHREEWEALRAAFLEDTDSLVEKLPAGPAKGNRARVAPYRPATPGDLTVARQVLTEQLRRPKVTPVQVLSALSQSGFVLMRSTQRKHRRSRTDPVT